MNHFRLDRSIRLKAVPPNPTGGGLGASLADVT